MTRPSTRSARPEPPVVRCAIYTRKSTEDGLEQEFNSLDAQRLAGENYVRSQAGEGWQTIPDQYDDGGFTGGNMDRPALKRLITDIEAGRIDCVVVYKVDRLSRSLLDFSRILELFEKHSVSFVSVTQLFNTANSMGRLMLNVLLSFAQFEREIISERTRDKIAAARRRGKWVGGMPLLGYDLTPGSKLAVNETEAHQVRTIFDLYLQERSLIRVIAELDQRGWNNKEWTTRAGTARGGNPFTKATLHKLLTNITYLGKVRYKNEVHDGEHAAVVDPEIWKQTQAILQKNGRTGGRDVRNKFGALLRGLLRCVPCNSAMTPSHSKKKDGRHYRYYVCCHAQKRGWANCPCPSIPAEEIEKFVVDQLQSIACQPDFINQILSQTHVQQQSQVVAIETEQAALRRSLTRWNSELQDALPRSTASPEDPAVLGRLVDLQDRIRNTEQQMTRLREKLVDLKTSRISPQQTATAMQQFAPVWGVLTPREQIRVIELLVERVDFDGNKGTVAVTFRPEGLRQFSDESTTAKAAT